jgi:hypothetical protein
MMGAISASYYIRDSSRLGQTSFPAPFDIQVFILQLDPDVLLKAANSRLV